MSATESRDFSLPTNYLETSQAIPQRIQRTARKQHEVLIVRNHEGTAYVYCPLKTSATATRTVSASKSRRWQATGPQLFFECV